jgi:hypothetical protein
VLKASTCLLSVVAVAAVKTLDLVVLAAVRITPNEWQQRLHQN